MDIQLEHMFCHLHLNMIALLHTCLEILEVHLLVKGIKLICMYYDQHLHQHISHAILSQHHFPCQVKAQTQMIVLVVAHSKHETVL